jgi:hypothetical protein
MSAATAAFPRSGHASAGSASPKRLVPFHRSAFAPLDDWNGIPDDLRQLILKALAGQDA